MQSNLIETYVWVILQFIPEIAPHLRSVLVYSKNENKIKIKITSSHYEFW